MRLARRSAEREGGGCGTRDTTAPYAYSWTGVGDGTYSLTATAADSSGAVGTSSPVRVTVGPSQPLAAADFIAADTDAQSALLTEGPTISRVRARGLVLRLDFAAPSADSPGRSARVRLW